MSQIMTDILFITVDSLRADHVGWHGYERNTTPRLDELAKNAHTFTNSFANGCGTNRSFPSIMTSVYPNMYGGYDRLSESQTTLAEAFRDTGYRTGGFHSNPYLLGQYGYDRGFDTFYDSNTETSTLARLRQWVKDTLDHDGVTFRTLDWAFGASEKKAGFNPGTPFVKADELTDRAINWAEDQNGDDRFLWVHYMDVHHPYDPPKEYQLVFRNDVISSRRAVKLRRKMLDSPGAVTDAELSELVDLYDGEIRFFDAEATRLIRAVRDQWGSDTVVAVTSDHGDELADHGGFNHHSTYFEEIIHVPLLIDGDDSSGSHDEIVELLDVAPTLLDYAAIDCPNSYVGSSLKPLIESDQWNKEHAIIEQVDSHAYRDMRWKYITRNDGQKALYDLSTDPDEQSDVSDEYQSVISEIDQRLEAHKDRVRSTDEELEGVDIDGTVEDRLEQLGYR